MYLQTRLVQYILENGVMMSYELALNLNIAMASVFVCWWYWIYLYGQPGIAKGMLKMLRRNAGTS